MCLVKTPKVSAARVAASDNTEATRQSDAEMKLRRRRAGAAANVLTSATGIPGAVSQMGGVAS